LLRLFAAFVLLAVPLGTYAAGHFERTGQMPAFGTTDRVKLSVYSGGHMFYSRPDSAAKFKADAKALYGQ
jgi:carboxypeptidase C (cathepsin A)